METPNKKPHKIAKGKAVFQTQLPIDLLEDLQKFSEEFAVPKTLVTEKLLRYGLRIAKETGSLPL